MAQQQTPAAGSGTLDHQPVATTSPPAIGQYWPEARGIYGGPVAYPDGTVAGIAWANDLAGLPAMPWGEYGKRIPGADSYHDGLANTEAMAAAGSALAKSALDGGAYIPAPIEALQLFATLKNQIGPGVAWTSKQYSADNAWCQNFDFGLQNINLKDCEFRAVPVRRLILQYFDASKSGAAQEGGAA